MTDAENPVANHGLIFEFHVDGVDLIDTSAPGQARVRMTFAEYDAFFRGALAGEFDLEALRGTDAGPS